MRALWLLTGGRPMIRLDLAFSRPLGGPDVWLMVDRLGRYWLATSRWSLNRTDAEI